MSAGAQSVVNGDVIRVGSRVRVHGDEDECEFVVVDPTEADASAGRVCSESPLGRAVLGCVLGQMARVQAPDGDRAVRIVAILGTSSEAGG
jgi:transcription elongation GreA/GreB family factor